MAAVAGLALPKALAAPASAEVPLAAAMPQQAGPPDMIARALAALDTHASLVPNRDRIGVADYSLYSNEYRFHIVDVAGGKISRSYLVSHGKGSDRANSGMVQRFSNVPGSNASSDGAFLTGQEYYGKHGRSRRLHGLDDRNDQAFDRAIVIHGASYVDRNMALNQGRVGRSLGCFAFEKCEIAEVLELLGPGRLLFSAR